MPFFFGSGRGERRKIVREKFERRKKDENRVRYSRGVYNRGGYTQRITDRRIKISVFFLTSLVLLFVVRSAKLSLFSPELRERAKEQSKTVIYIKGKRGDILARAGWRTTGPVDEDKVRNINGEILAKDIPSYSIWINPLALNRDGSKMRNIRKIAKMLGISDREIMEKLNRKAYFVWLKRHISVEKFDELMKVINEYGFGKNEIGHIKEWKRFYPYGEVTAHITGFTNVDGRGLAGLELSFDRELEGGNVAVPVLRDALGRIIMNMPPREPMPGSKIITTIDIDLQTILFRELKDRMIEMRAKGAFAVAMEPNTGEILAAVSLPSYDPNSYSEFVGTNLMTARFYQWIFEPGSIFKVFTLAIALEEELVSENDTFFCHNGEWTFRGKTIYDVKKIGYADLSEILAKSSNICAAQIALLIGKEKFYKYLKKFGFGEKTGIELPGEEEGILHPHSRWYEVDLATLGYGYFIGVNALQIVRAFSVFANDGYLVNPFIVSKIVSPSGEIIFERKPEYKDKILSPETLSVLKGMLRKAVVSGTGIGAEVPFFLSAGKTGTARKMRDGKYVQQYFSSFIGFSPYEKPQIVLLVIFDEPEERYYGGEVAAPVFSKTVEKYLSSLMLAQGINDEKAGEEEKNKGEEKTRRKAVSASDMRIDGKNEKGENRGEKNDIKRRITLSEFLENLPDDVKKNKKIVVSGYGFVSHFEEKENEIRVFLSP